MENCTTLISEFILKSKCLMFITVVGCLLNMDANTAGAMLHIICDGDDVGAEVYVNGKYRDKCPADVQVSAGTLQLRVLKKIDASHDRVFEQENHMAEGSTKRVEVVLNVQLTAKGRRLEQKAGRLYQAKSAWVLDELKNRA